MVLQVTQYYTPDVLIGEDLVPNNLNIATQPAVVGFVGHGSRRKNIINERVRRGEVTGESLTLASSVPHTATLTNRALRNLEVTAVYRDGVALGDAFVSFDAPFVLGTDAGPFDLSSTRALGLTLDGKPALVISLSHNGGASGNTGALSGIDYSNPTVEGFLVSVEANFSGTGGNGATRAEIADVLNGALAAATAAATGASAALAYGAAYSAVASDGTSGIRITSPGTSSAADVELVAPPTNDALTTLFGAPAGANRSAETIIEVAAAVYSAASTYTADYVALEDTEDPLSQSGVLDITRVGSDPGVPTFEEDTDYAEGADAVDWSILAGTSVDSRVEGGTGYDVSTNDSFRLALDGKSPVTIELDSATLATDLADAGYAQPASNSAATPDEIAANINAILASDPRYGAEYAAVATTPGVGAAEVIRITSPLTGEAALVQLSVDPTAAATQSATLLEVFSLTVTGAYEVTGTGRKPADGVDYFVTYEVTRPSSDYEVQKRFFTRDDAVADLGAPSAQNPLAHAVDIAFEQGANSVAVVQVDDALVPGSPTRNEIQAALAITEKADVITELCVLSTSLATQLDLKDHVNRMNGPLAKRYRRGYYGMPRDTEVGNRSTADTLVFRAAQTLLVTGENPGRGRHILVAPPQAAGVSRTVPRADGSGEDTINVDGSLLAAAVAARRASLTAPFQSLALRSIVGFNIDDIDDPWAPGEVRTLGSNGVMVVRFDDGGDLIVEDPRTTEGAGAGQASFLYPSATTQKDNVTRKVRRGIRTALLGIVPLDVADFIVDIKQVIRGVLESEVAAGNIAPFTDAQGNARRVDLTTDIDVKRDANDPTKYRFTYKYNLRYPFLRAEGTFSVDNPFPVTV